MKHSNSEHSPLARSTAIKRGALLLILVAGVGCAAAVAASCDDTGPSPVGDHPDEAGMPEPEPEDAEAEGGEGGEAGEEAGQDGGEDADAAEAGPDAADADAD